MVVLAFGVLFGIAIGFTLAPWTGGEGRGSVAPWRKVAHRVATAIGGLGSFAALVVVLRQFRLLRAQSELVQKNIAASTDAQLYVRLDSFNRFVFEHSQEYDLLDKPYRQAESPEQRSKLHRMCEHGFTFFEEIFKHHVRQKLQETGDWDEWQQNMIHFFRKPYVRGYWRAIAGRYAKCFQALVGEVIGTLLPS